MFKFQKNKINFKRNTLILFLIIMFSFQSVVYAETSGGIKSTVIIASGTSGGPTLLSNDFYGSSGNTIGDLDADGVVDMIIGAYGDDTGGNRKGAAYISYLNTDGSIKSTVKLTGATVNGATLAVDDFYGYASSGLGDLDNDGIPDIAIGVKNDDTGGSNRGAVYIHYMNRDGSIKSTVKLTGATPNGAVLADLDTYGYSVFGPGDIDNDGIPDLISGAGADDTGGSNRGAVYIHYMNRDGSIKSTVKIASGTLNGPVLADGACYGVGVSSIGDLDADGIIDLVVGANCDDTGGTDRGAIFIHLMNVNGSIKSTVKIASGTLNGPTLSDSDFYGIAIAKLDDIDGDDIPDIGVASYFDDSSGANLGAFYIHYMNRDASIKSTVRINSATPNGASNITSGPTGARYSNALFSLGDLNIDGAVDIAVGAPTDSITVPAGNQHGRTFLHFMQPVIGNRITETSLVVTEDGTVDTFNVSLKSKPTSAVTINISNGTQVTTSPSSLSFSTVNWSTPQTVTVSAVDDESVESSHTDTVTLTNSSADTDYNNLTNSISVSITDNDKASSPGVIYCTDTITTFCRKTDTMVSTPTAIPVQVVNTTPQITPANNDLCPANQHLTQNLKAGSRDGQYSYFTRGIVKEVKILQAHMNRLGFASGKEDGILGPISDGAIKRMQKSFITKPDGLVGPLTRELINNSCGER